MDSDGPLRSFPEPQRQACALGPLDGAPALLEGVWSRTRLPGLLTRMRSMISRGAAGVQLAPSGSLPGGQMAHGAHRQKLFEEATALAGIGIWACDLPNEGLQWTRGTYDLFGLPAGSRLDRKQIIRSYTEESLNALESVRSAAIAQRTGFDLDAQIVTAAGDRRWIRITASVESDRNRAVRLFGTKRDITEEKLLWEQIRYRADFDPMTGLANRNQFDSRLAELCRRGPGALLLIDLDRFKQVNDTVGHAGGDQCLKQAADRIRTACRRAALVARIGGDEFAVLAGPDMGPAAVENLARDIIAAMAAPMNCGGVTFSLGASVGIAFLTGYAPAQAYESADAALYAAKFAGGGTFRVPAPIVASIGPSGAVRAHANGN